MVRSIYRKPVFFRFFNSVCIVKVYSEKCYVKHGSQTKYLSYTDLINVYLTLIST